jgi:hypothetical protein
MKYILIFVLLLSLCFAEDQDKPYSIKFRNFIGKQLIPKAGRKTVKIEYKTNIPRIPALALSMDGGVTYTNVVCQYQSGNLIYKLPNLKSSMAKFRLRSNFSGNVYETYSEKFSIDVWDCSGCGIKTIIKWQDVKKHQNHNKEIK